MCDNPRVDVDVPPAVAELMGDVAAAVAGRLRQHHVGLVCWVGDAASTADEINRLERAIGYVAGRAACDDEHHARLRETLLVFLQSGGSWLGASVLQSATAPT